jgi:hypothetical protein
MAGPERSARNTTGAGRRAAGTKWLLRLLAHFLVGFLAAWASVSVLGLVDAGRDLQRVAAFVCVAGALAVVFSKQDLRPSDSLGVIATVVGLAVSSVAALGTIGSIDEVPALGCIASEGRLKATISKEAATVWSEATPASPATGFLLLQGCRMKFTGYCLGAVHRDAFEQEVTDSRWLIISDGRGLVASGHTVGTIPEDETPSKCPGSTGPPGPVRFRSAEIDSSTQRIRLFAQSDRAAIIGFAIRENDQWKRLGWDTSAIDEEPVVVAFPQATTPHAGATVAAIACIGYQRPSGKATSGRLASGDVPASKDPAAEPSNVQPTARPMADAACDASVPPPQ